ncbi:unnamed protein product [Candidula unifasciata]|uniref:Rhodanese domain-containing protein n=1 Tax=Candidula unifasciata TaxID=100452 RepID=A0A8S3ZB47_9EUPU|nr:unnamed protein product [Candidula unifasciata]
MKLPFGSTLVTTQWLRDVVRLNLPDKKILDASWHLPNTGRNALLEYNRCHIPGAVFFDIDECADKSSGLAHTVPPAEVFEAYVGALGISNDTHVIIYDNHPQFPVFSAQRVWWTFRLFGHSKISVLDGGLPKWISEGGEVTDKLSWFPRKTYAAKFNPGLIKYFKDIETNIHNPEFLVVDVRPEGRFQGIAAEPRPDIKPGCIPHSVSLPFTKFYDLDNRSMKSAEQLQQIFEASGIDLNKNIVASCGSGISACLLALAGHLCNKDDIAVYDGSWTEWFARAPDNLKKNIPV